LKSGGKFRSQGVYHVLTCCLSCVHVLYMWEQWLNKGVLSFFGTDTTEAVDEPEDIMQVAEFETCECQACCNPSTSHQPLNVCVWFKDNTFTWQ